jgi:hypothetical protein
MDFRFIFSAGTLYDYSKEMNDYFSSTVSMDIDHTNDYLYIGSHYPFASIYFKVGTPSSLGINPSISYWNGSSWVGAVEVIDETEGFSKSGYISFQIDRFKSSWTRDDTRMGGTTTERIAGLGDLNIYDLYWLRISFDGSDEVGLSWVGHNFITDNDLKVEYPAFNNSTLIAAVESGKTNWESQIVRASRLVVEDLVQKRIIKSQNQIIDRRKLMSMTVAKTAEIIYTILGDDYLDQRREAAAEYSRRSKVSMLNIDENMDGDLDLAERKVRQGYLYR